MTKKNFKKIIIILGIIILPLIYSLFYLKGFWDPYNSLKDVPIAVVNEDNCKKNCKSTELITKLKEKKAFKFEETNSKKANEGLINKDYYAIIKIPKDFTSSFETIKNKERKQTTITYIPNTKTNYLASQIIKTAVKEIESRLNQTTNKEIVKNLTNNLKTVPYQTKQISYGLNQINNGSKKLQEAGKTLNKGTTKLKENYNTFDNGINNINQGINKLQTNYKILNNGLTEVYEGAHTLKIKTENLNTLTENFKTLTEGSNNLATSISTYKTNSEQMIDQTKIAYNSIINYINNNPDKIEDPNLKLAYQIALGYTTPNESGTNSLTNIKIGTNKLFEGYNNINNGINTLNNNISNLTELKNGIDNLDKALLKIQNGSNETLKGIKTLNTGINSLKTNSSKIEKGIETLNTGTNKLENSTKELNNSLESAKNKLDEKITKTEKEISSLENLDNYAKKPVKAVEKDYGNVKTYGTFFSPYFMSLSLWVGGILILMGLYYDPEGRFKTLGKNSNNRGLRLVFYDIIGIIQAIILAFILKLSLGFNVTNIPLYYISCILISEAFLAIIMFLFFNFKDIGKFLSIVLLVLQLAACGGTFPIETEPLIYQTIYNFMPMTYSVNLLRESFVTINKSMLTENILILLGILTVFTILIFITGTIKKRKEIKVNKQKPVINN